MNNLINQELKVINIGLSSFAENLKKENTPVVSVAWVPPAGGNKKMLELLERYNKIRRKDDVQESLKKSFNDIKDGRTVMSSSADKMIEKLDKSEGL